MNLIELLKQVITEGYDKLLPREQLLKVIKSEYKNVNSDNVKKGEDWDDDKGAIVIVGTDDESPTDKKGLPIWTSRMENEEYEDDDYDDFGVLKDFNKLVEKAGWCCEAIDIHVLGIYLNRWTPHDRATIDKGLFKSASDRLKRDLNENTSKN